MEIENANENRRAVRVEDDAEIAARLRRKLLRRMERMVAAIPKGAVTETKAQESGEARVFKLRDLTAAYKDLAGGLPGSGEEDVEDLTPLEELLR